MRKKNVVAKILFAVFLFVSLSGCGIRHYKMPAEDMHIAPSLGALPDKITLVGSLMDPVTDAAEGFVGIAWPSVMWDKKTEEVSKLLALNLGFVPQNGRKTCYKNLLTIIPKPLSEVEGNKLAIFNRSGSKVFNHKAESRPVKGKGIIGKISPLSQPISPSDYGDFLTVIKSGEQYVLEISKDSEQFRKLVGIFTEFRIAELEMARKYIYKKYGSNLTKEELQEIAYKDSIVRNFIEWIGKDWYVFLATGMSLTGAAVQMGVVKILSLNSIFEDKINLPGYSEYITDAESTARIAFRIMAEYGSCLSGK